MDFENRGGKTKILVLRHMNEQTREGMNKERERTVRRGSVPLKAEEERVVGKQAGSKEGFGIRGQHSQPWWIWDSSVHQLRTTEASLINPNSWGCRNHHLPGQEGIRSFWRSPGESRVDMSGTAGKGNRNSQWGRKVAGRSFWKLIRPGEQWDKRG